MVILNKKRGISTFSLGVADPGSGIRCFFDPWIRDPDPGSRSGMMIRELKNSFEGKKNKFFDAVPDPEYFRP
jgi:hypothetical protein